MPLSSRSILPHTGFKPCSDDVWELPKQNGLSNTNKQTKKKKKERKRKENNGK